jgi:regulator of protease activity HflC (stomatin/prohibitin superfamily)
MNINDSKLSQQEYLLGSTVSFPATAPEGNSMLDSPPSMKEYTQTIGQMPYYRPNVSQQSEERDLQRYIMETSYPSVDQGGCGCCCGAKTLNGCVDCLTCFFCSVSVIGCCYICSQVKLVKAGEYGFSMNNGIPEMLLPGRHFLLSPLNTFMHLRSQGDDVITAGPITIVRIPQGQLGFADDNGAPQVLLPGRHVRNSANFKYRFSKVVTDDFLEFGAVKIVTVKTGEVRICYDAGRVVIWPEGRYAVNSDTFRVAGKLNTQQQNLRFSKHSVLLDGGINMLVEGLLTYKVVNVQKLVREIGEGQLQRAIQDVTKAELSRVFAGVHLEQLASAQQHAPREPGMESKQETTGEEGLLGKSKTSDEQPGHSGRNHICEEVIRHISPLTRAWGVHVINFQLESTKIADVKYAHQYEEASLALSKAKANRRAVKATNEILLEKSMAKARALEIAAEGQKNATIISAEGEAQARKIEADSRNEAAKMMAEPFAKQFALQGLQVEFAKGLQAQVLTVNGNSGIASQFNGPQTTMTMADLGIDIKTAK